MKPKICTFIAVFRNKTDADMKRLLTIILLLQTFASFSQIVFEEYYEINNGFVTGQINDDNSIDFKTDKQQLLSMLNFHFSDTFNYFDALSIEKTVLNETVLYYLV